MKYPIAQCEKCRRFNKNKTKQRNKLYCLLKCEPLGESYLSAAFAWNKAISGDPNVYGTDGVVLSPSRYRRGNNE